MMKNLTITFLIYIFINFLNKGLQDGLSPLTAYLLNRIGHSQYMINPDQLIFFREPNLHLSRAPVRP